MAQAATDTGSGQGVKVEARTTDGDEGDGERIQARRLRVGLDVTDLVRITEQLGQKVSRRTLSALEAGERVRPVTLAKVEKALAFAEMTSSHKSEGDAVIEHHGEGALVTFEVTLPSIGVVKVTMRGPVPPGYAASEIAALLKHLDDKDVPRVGLEHWEARA